MCVVADCQLVFLDLAVCECPVVVEVGFRGVQLDGLCEVPNGLLAEVFTVEADAAVVVAVSVIWL